MQRKNANIITNPARLPLPISKEELEKLYLTDKKSLEDIGKQINRSRQCIARWMEYWGIKRRKSMEASKLKMIQKNNLRGPNWQGGRWFVKQNQTWFVYAPNHPRQKHNGGVAEHMLIAEKRIGRLLEPDEVVHHKNGNRLNNEPYNLCVMSKSSHQNLHRILGDVGLNLIVDGHIDIVLDNTSSEEDLNLVTKVYINHELIIK